jgi:hypothetical protein
VAYGMSVVPGNLLMNHLGRVAMTFLLPAPVKMPTRSACEAPADAAARVFDLIK